jgi:hypothetical protein
VVLHFEVVVAIEDLAIPACDVDGALPVALLESAVELRRRAAAEP